MTHSIVLLTGLLPTTGHRDLIRFAALIPNNTVHVLLSSRTFEPYDGERRVEVLKQELSNFNNIEFVNIIEDNAPQEPEDMPTGFWDYWRDTIHEAFPNVSQWDHVIASEPYGANVAESLNATFFPYDINRVHNPVKGSNVRSELWKQWRNVLPLARKDFMLRATLFGQESVGKTTLSKSISERLKVDWFVEYARPYLETVGITVDENAMTHIHRGQTALQELAMMEANHPIAIFDTDLFSTVGYYEIMLSTPPEECISDALRLKSDVYYVLPDDIPFEEDQLRYGGDIRESTREYWVTYRERFGLNIVEVPEGTQEEKTQWIQDDMKKRWLAKVKDLVKFQR